MESEHEAIPGAEAEAEAEAVVTEEAATEGVLEQPPESPVADEQGVQDADPPPVKIDRRKFNKGRFKKGEPQQKRGYQEVFAKLPNTAPENVEYDWIRSHPKMSRAYDVEPEQRSAIKFGVRDLLYSCNGPCPSKAAANALKRWVLNPDKFHEQRMGKLKLPTDSAADADALVAFDDLSEARKILADLRHG